MIRIPFNKFSILYIAIAWVLAMAPAVASDVSTLKLPEGFTADPSDGEFIQIRNTRGLTGYVDKTGRTIIPPTEDEVRYLGERRFLKRHYDEKHENVELIGVGGKHIAFLPAQINIRSEKFHDGMIQFSTHNHIYGFMNLQGKLQIKPDRIVQCKDFNEGFASVQFGGRNAEQFAALIDRNGRILAGPFKDGNTENFYNGLAQVRAESGYGLVDRSGHFVLPAQFQDVNQGDKFLSAQDGNGVWKIFSIDGKLIKALPKSITSLETADGDGPWVFGEEPDSQKNKPPRKATKFGVVNSSGTVVAPAKYDSIGAFSKGLAVVGENRGDKMIFGVLDKTGTLVKPIEYDSVWIGDDGIPIIQKTIKVAFDQEQWKKNPSNRTNYWKLFLQEYDLIGMDEQKLYNLLGEANPNSRLKPPDAPRRVQYSLLSGFCGNAYQGIEIEFSNDKKVTGWRAVDGWNGDHQWNRDNVVYVEPKNSIAERARLVPKNVAKEYEQN